MLYIFSTPTGSKRLASEFSIYNGLTVLMLANCIATPALAADSSTLETYDLGGIVVIGEQPGVEATGTLYEITAADIERKAARSLDEAIELLPGVNVRTAADGTPRIDIRGYRTRNIDLLLNGVPINSAYDGQFDPTLIPTDYIAKIKVTPGSSSVIYGENGLGAVINIITKKGYKGIQANVAGEIGNGSHHRVWGNVAGGMDNADFFLSLSNQDRSGWPLPSDFESTPEEDGDLRNNSDRTRNNIYFNTGYRPDDDWSLGLTFNYVDSQFGKPPSTINDSTDPYANKQRYERVEDETVYTAQFSAVYDPDGPWSTRNWGYMNIMDEHAARYDDDTYSSMDDETIKNTFDIENSSRILGLHTQTSYEHQWDGTVTFMLDGRQEHFEEQGYIRDIPINVNSGNGGGGGGGNKSYQIRSIDSYYDIEILSTGLEATFTPIENLGLSVGYGHHWLFKDDGNEDNDSSFNVGVYYDVVEWTRLRGAVARKVKAPSIRQLYDTDGGDSSLSFETAYHYELGADQQLPYQTTLNISGFISTVENFIERNNITGLFENNEEYEFKGVELSIENRFFERLLFRANYTFLDSQDKSDSSQKDDLQYRPRHKAVAEMNYDFGFGISGFASFMYVGEEYYYSRKEPLQKAELQDYMLLNLKLNYNLFNDHTSLYLGADNILDENYQESYGYPQMGRFIYGGIKLRY